MAAPRQYESCEPYPAECGEAPSCDCVPSCDLAESAGREGEINTCLYDLVC